MRNEKCCFMIHFSLCNKTDDLSSAADTEFISPEQGGKLGKQNQAHFQEMVGFLNLPTS